MNIVKALKDVLDEEQRILLSGDYGKLESLAITKTDLAEKLSQSSPDVPVEDYEVLVKLAAANEQLLSAARRGIKAAIAQLKQISDGEHQSTYSREGARQPLARRTSVMQKL